MKTKLICCLAFLILPLTTFAQQNKLRYTNARELMIIGKALPTKGSLFIRLDSLQNRDMPEAVRKLSQHSAGVAFLFESNATTIAAKWKLAKQLYHANMTPIAHSGLDLYCLKNGTWQYVGVGRPKEKTGQQEVIIDHLTPENRQYMLYCPLYNQLDSLSIGVNDSAQIRKPAKPGIDTTKRVVLYGSSILQGASASRPGMAYPAILERRTGWEFVNLGFSGNAKMEIELARYLVQVPASVYVLDCVPNPSPEQIAERAYPFIKYILDNKKGTPLVLVESVHRETAYWDQTWKKRVADQNRLFREAYERLKKEGHGNMFYIKADGLAGTDHEAAIDGTHLTDLGFMRMADTVLPVIKQAMTRR